MERVLEKFKKTYASFACGAHWCSSELSECGRSDGGSLCDVHMCVRRCIDAENGRDCAAACRGLRSLVWLGLISIA